MSESSNQYPKQNSQEPKQFRGGEKKVMKKSLSAILAASMAFSMFASAAFADTSSKTSEEKFQEMKTAGIFQGYPDGKSHLEETMTRAEFAKALAALLGLEDDSAAASVYSDIAANHWAIGEIGALTAEQIMEGTGAGKFGPKVNVSIEQLAKIVVGAMKLEVKEDATVEGKTSAWATPFVAAALDAGLISKVDDYTVLATRGNLVDSSYEVFAKGQISVKSTKVVDAKNIEVTFSDDQVVKKELSEALKVGVATKVEVEYQGKKYTVEVTLAELAAEAKAAGAKKVEVKLNQAVDTAKAKFEVKRGSSDVKINKVTFSEDKMTATLELDSKLVEAEYTVNLKEVSQNTVTSTFKAENEKLTALEFAGEKLAITDNTYTQAAISYRLVNQYNEDVTKQYGAGITWTASKGSIRSNVNGKLTIGFLASENVRYAINEQVSITGIHTTSGLTVSKLLTVGPEAMVESVTVKEIYHPDKKEPTMASNFNEYVLLIEAKDQYGNTMTAKDVNEDVLVTVSNPTIFNIDQNSAKDEQGPDKDQVGIQLTNPPGTYRTEGTNSILFVARNGGKQTKFDVTITKGAVLNSFTLETPGKEIAAGDAAVRIPFSALDANGGQIVKYKDLKNKVNLTATSGTFELKEEYSTGNAYLEWKVPTVQGRYSLNAILQQAPFTSSSLTIDVRAQATPSTVQGVKDFALNQMYVAGQTATVKAANIVIHDDYNRAIELKNDTFFNNYVVVIEKLSGSIGLNLNGGTATNQVVLKSTSDAANFKPDVATSGRFAIKLADKVATGDNVGTIRSTKEVTLSFEESGNLTNFAIKDIAKSYYQNWVDVKVTARNSSGQTVEIPASQYRLSPGLNAEVSNVDTEDATERKVRGVSGLYNNHTNEEVKKVGFTVTFTNGVTTPLSKEFDVTNIARKVTTVEFKSGGGYTGSNGVVEVSKATVTGDFTLEALLNNAVTLKDQYGVAIPAVVRNAANEVVASTTATLNKFIAHGTDSAIDVPQFAQVQSSTVTGATVGDKFVIDFVTHGGHAFTVQINIVQ